MSIQKNVLEEAADLVYGQRQEDYGDPTANLTRVGKMWAAILGLESVPPERVALCMIAMKVSRLCNAPKRDSVVDIAGYAATLQRVMESRSRDAVR